VVGQRLNKQRMTWEYYVRSRKSEDYRQMLFASLYHPPVIDIVPEQSTDGCLYLNHRFEGKPLVNEYVANTMLGIEYLWGSPVNLETSEAEVKGGSETATEDGPQVSWARVRYNMKDRQFSREVLKADD
jgi:stage V sporulation protein R